MPIKDTVTSAAAETVAAVPLAGVSGPGSGLVQLKSEAASSVVSDSVRLVRWRGAQRKECGAGGIAEGDVGGASKCEKVVRRPSMSSSTSKLSKEFTEWTSHGGHRRVNDADGSGLRASRDGYSC